MKNNIRKYRVMAEMTQSDLAGRIGVSRQTIHAIEAGKYVPSTILALKLAGTFKAEVTELFGLEEGD